MKSLASTHFPTRAITIALILWAIIFILSNTAFARQPLTGMHFGSPGDVPIPAIH